MRKHRQFQSSSNQFLRPSNVFSNSSQIHDSLQSNTSYDNLHRGSSPYVKQHPRSLYSVSNLAKSSNNLHSLDKRANADPELTAVHKSKKGYHLNIDLRAHILNGLQMNQSSNNRSNVLSSEHQQHQHQHQFSQSNIRSNFNRSSGDIAGLNGGSRVSMVNLTGIENFPLPPPIINRPKVYSSNQKTVVNLEGARNNNVPAASSQSNMLGDGYIMKSWKASDPKKVEKTSAENKENIEFDLCLYGTVNKKVEKVITEPKIVQKEGESRRNIREIVEESETTRSSSVGIPSINIKPPKRKQSHVEEKISTGLITNLSNVKYDLEPEEQLMLKRLMRGAPSDSFKKRINIERETEEIFGPLPEEEVEKLYSKEMINVDVISQIVHLELNQGMADVQLKLIFNKIVPVEGSEDTFKMTKVIVNKEIMVDLTVTEDRRKIFEDVLRTQQNGVLDKEYTWMLYKIFSTLADNGNAFGVSEGRMRVDKEVGEDRVYNLNKEMFNARGNTDKKFQILEETFLETDDLKGSSRQDSQYDKDLLSRSTSGWSFQDTNRPSINEQRPSFNEQRPSFNEQRPSFNEGHVYNEGHNNVRYNDRLNSENYNEEFSNGGYKHVQRKKETFEPRDIFSETNVSRSSKRIEEASNNFMKPKDTSWKNEYSRWLSTDNNTSNNRSSRLNVYSYLRPGGSRNYDYLREGDNFYQSHNGNETDLKQEESVSQEVLNHNGLRGGAHRERMRSYERGLDRDAENSYNGANPNKHTGTRTSRRETYNRESRF